MNLTNAQERKANWLHRLNIWWLLFADEVKGRHFLQDGRILKHRRSGSRRKNDQLICTKRTTHCTRLLSPTIIKVSLLLFTTTKTTTFAPDAERCFGDSWRTSCNVCGWIEGKEAKSAGKNSPAFTSTPRRREWPYREKTRMKTH